MYGDAFLMCRDAEGLDRDPEAMYRDAERLDRNPEAMYRDLILILGKNIMMQR